MILSIKILTRYELSKAFDTVDQDILRKKLNIYGIKSKRLEWRHSYLSARK